MMHKRYSYSVFFMAVLLAPAFIHAKNFPSLPLQGFHFSGYAQGTMYHISYYAPDSTVTKKAFDSILVKIDSSLSTYKSYSLISRFNNAASGIDMDEHLSVVVLRSLQIHQETGVSDITCLLYTSDAADE